MKLTVTKSMFKDMFAQMGRKDQFSYDALGQLFEYLEECDPDYDLDVIALCCDYCEDSAENIAASYSIECDDPEDLESVVEDYLNEHTFLIGKTTEGFLYQVF